MAEKLRVVVVGLGYFSRFHLAAWKAQEHAEIVGLCDTDEATLAAACAELGVPGDADLAVLLERTGADIVDIVAPPPAHDRLVRAALASGRTVICQKPFCTSLEEAGALADAADAVGAQVVIHENFRFQPWHRQIRNFLQSGRLGRVFQARFALRPGDGRGPDAYLDRQPGFRTMPRLLIHETGVHFIDLFRWLLGDIESVYAEIRRLNPTIRGEDAGMMILTHASGAQSVFDGNRLSDHVAGNLRHTMGEMQIEGEGGVLSLDGDGQISFRPFGTTDAETVGVRGDIDAESFGGGCVAALIGHVVDAVIRSETPENSAREYLHVMEVKEAAYRSAADGHRVSLGREGL